MACVDDSDGLQNPQEDAPRLPASAWRGGYRGSAWALIGAGEPQQIHLIDPERTQPLASWLGEQSEMRSTSGQL